MAEGKSILSLSNVSFAYPAGNSALEKITLEVREGEVVGLVGANGAGKTSLLKILAGYMDRAEGEVLLGGRPVEDFNPRKLREFVTLVEQNPEAQLVGPTVEDELARACRILGYQGRLIQEKVGHTLRLVGMTHARDWFLDEMSCGERRRIALALALITNPSLLLLDEPLADLDHAGIQDTIQTIRELKRKGLSIVIAAHHLDDLVDLSDRIAVLGEGRMLCVEGVREVLADDKLLQEAALTVPPLQRLFFALQSEGALPQEPCPLTFQDALVRLKQALGADGGSNGVRAEEKAGKAVAVSVMVPAGAGAEDSASEKSERSPNDTQVLERSAATGVADSSKS